MSLNTNSTSAAVQVAAKIVHALAAGALVRINNYVSSDDPNAVYSLVLSGETYDELRERQAHAAEALRKNFKPATTVESEAASELDSKWSPGPKEGSGQRGPNYYAVLLGEEAILSNRLYLMEGADPSEADTAYIRGLRQVQRKLVSGEERMKEAREKTLVKKMLTERFLDHGQPSLYQLKIDANTSFDVLSMTEAVEILVPAELSWDAYRPFAARTEAGAVPILEFHTPVNFARLQHAVLGIITEIDELEAALEASPFDKVLVGEECGDFFWYSVIFVNLYFPRAAWDFSLPEQRPAFASDPALLSRALVHARRQFADAAKRWSNYAPTGDGEKRAAQFSSIIESWRLLAVLVLYAAELAGISPEVIRSRNARKLMIRYGKKFSSLAAFARDLASERVVLSQ